VDNPGLFEDNAVDMGLGLQLAPGGSAPAAETLRPGDTAWVTLAWRAETVPPVAPELVLELFGRPGPDDPLGSIGRIQTYHGGGLYPASVWKSGETIHSRLGIPLADAIDAPVVARATVRLVEGNAADIGRVKVVPHPWPEPPAGEPLAIIGDAVELLAWEFDPAPEVAAGEELTIHLLWRVIAPLPQPYTTLVHLSRADGRGDGAPPLAQADAPPRDGYYPTDWWAPGEIIPDSYTLSLPDDLPPGDYAVEIGLYDADLRRLPLWKSGQREANDTFMRNIRIVDN
jgi:hypothetical protein